MIVVIVVGLVHEGKTGHLRGGHMVKVKKDSAKVKGKRDANVHQMKHIDVRMTDGEVLKDVVVVTILTWK
jgi:hypothetical protein